MYPRLLLAATFLAFSGCASTEDWQLRAMAGGGWSNLDEDHDTGSSSTDGTQQSLRAELAKSIDYLPDAAVGLRLLVGMHQFDATIEGVDNDLETQDLALAPVFRGYFWTGKRARIYGELFTGYRHMWKDLSLDGPGGSTTLHGNDGGVYVGGGLGAEFVMTDQQCLLVGAEWSWNSMDVDEVTDEVQDVSLLVGWSWRF